ncbi:ribosomal RNA small subunit methyltransferase nep1 [Apiospora phragmitis]|uniref:Ribosomal RNA small subunit methyltransferase nep1 n=1 Tax=Apiospora phragmitis TaxID=2905665 RepID=A0ABR1TQV9_9PEZI
MERFKPLTWARFPGDGGILHVRGHSTKFTLHCFSKNLAAAPADLTTENDSTTSMNHEGDTDDGPTPAMTSAEAARALLQPFLSLMNELAPRETESHTLYNYLYPQQFNLAAEATQNDTTIRPRISKEKPVYHPPGQIMSLPMRTQVPSSFRRYSSQQVKVPLSWHDGRNPMIYGPQEVHVDNNGTKCFLKVFRPSDGDLVPSATIMELRKYDKIEEAIAKGRLSPQSRICRLHGIVVDSYDDLPEEYKTTRAQDHLVGLLLTYIEPMQSYRCSGLNSMSDEFIRQHHFNLERDLDDILQSLHNADIVWGDVSVYNVLVGKDNHIYGIDFGGSFTPGWIDESNQNTKKGDLQG